MARTPLSPCSFLAGLLPRHKLRELRASGGPNLLYGFPLPAGVRVLTDWFRDGGYFTANLRHMPQPIQWKGTAKTDWNFTYRTVLKRLRSVLEKWIEDSHDQGKELEPLDLVRRKGMTKAQTHPQSGYALDEKTLEPKNLTLPGKKP